MLPELYHAHQSRYTDDLPFWLDLAVQAGGPLLELGCGTGRVLIPLAQTGCQAFGIDRDLAMLGYLQAQVAAGYPRPWLVAADITHFYLALKLSLVILPCNTMSTLHKYERLACLDCVHSHLQPGGLFAVSIPNPITITSMPARSGAELEDEFVHPRTGNPVQVSSSWRRRKDVLQVTWNYDHLLPDGRVERYTSQVTQRMIPVSEYLDEIHAADLKQVTLYGDFDRSPYEDDSPYLICVAQR